ncbi:transposase [Lentzea sp. NPDC051208]|uniref:RNA-guided endonuclease InsQ/TnpB family protein n=1 Tax=Lentzea sp. NPDC051208 TaxID=3154642 RepID=UPI003411F88F
MRRASESGAVDAASEPEGQLNLEVGAHTACMLSSSRAQMWVSDTSPQIEFMIFAVRLRYKYRVYPTPPQQESLTRAFGCARVVFNDGLRLRQETHTAGSRYISDGDLSKQVITQAKKTEERAWLGEVSAVVLQQALADLNVAYRNFFASVSGKRKGRKVAAPRFRSRKDNRQAIRFTANARFKVLDNGRLRLPKIGDVRVAWSRELPAPPSSVTIVRDAAGRFFASFVVDALNEPLPETSSEVGIDLGLTHFAVLSDSTKVTAPQFLRNAARKLRKLQQDLSRKTKGSNRRKKAVAKVARAHAKVTDTRRDWQHKLSTMIIRDNQAVFVEDLCVAGLARTRLAKSVHDAGWAQFTAMLEYKASRHGRTFGRVDRWFPSTRTCSACGQINGKMPLGLRAWTCPCGAVHDRDVNAAINILAAGRAERLNDRGARVRPAAMPAPRGETVIHPGAAQFTRSVEGIPTISSGGERQSQRKVLAATVPATSPTSPMIARCLQSGAVPSHAW